ENRDALQALVAERTTKAPQGSRRAEGAPASSPALTVAVQAEPKGTAHAVLAARDALAGFSGTLLVLCGDAPCVSPRSIAALLAEPGVRRADVSVLSGDLQDPMGYGRIIRGPDGDLAAIIEEKDATADRRAIREINSGIFAFECPRMLET